METIKIALKDKIILLKLQEFDTDIDIDEILQIDYSNILGEILTFPVVHNRIGILRAELENRLSNLDFDLKVYSAKLGEMFRKNNLKTEIDKSGNKKFKNPTVQEIDNAVLLDQGYQLRQKEFFRAKKEFQIFDSLYWSSKDKSNKLDKCAISIKPEDFENEIIEGSINNVMIKVRDKLIK